MAKWKITFNNTFQFSDGGAIDCTVPFSVEKEGHMTFGDKFLTIYKSDKQDDVAFIAHAGNIMYVEEVTN